MPVKVRTPGVVFPGRPVLTLRLRSHYTSFLSIAKRTGRLIDPAPVPVNHPGMIFIREIWYNEFMRGLKGGHDHEDHPLFRRF